MRFAIALSLVALASEVLGQITLTPTTITRTIKTTESPAKTVTVTKSITLTETETETETTTTTASYIQQETVTATLPATTVTQSTTHQNQRHDRSANDDGYRYVRLCLNKAVWCIGQLPNNHVNCYGLPIMLCAPVHNYLCSDAALWLHWSSPDTGYSCLLNLKRPSLATGKKQIPDGLIEDKLE
ncbi:hypothetical protein B0T24DRAFT_597268 [Lasiosphaeria ovina]|uniref:Uncharacterized protein n=1 Tax=Lasiosphaeria ovina TaxID=92902 RepID=A0AAE0N0B2_9PEZI|nr:hypothetical protein B0T24DRAFT_597268 [Lasiosphaeria ovina]